MAANVQRGINPPIYRGDTITLLTTFLQPSGSPYNITGWYAWATLKMSLGQPDSAALSQVTTASGGITFPSPTTGVAQVVFPPTATSVLGDAPNLLLNYDVQGQDLSGNIITGESGTILLTPDVTLTTTPTGGPTPPVAGFTQVVTASQSPYAAPSSISYLGVDVTGGPVTINAASPTIFLLVANMLGSALTNNITVNAPAGMTIESPQGNQSYGSSAVIQVAGVSYSWMAFGTRLVLV